MTARDAGLVGSVTAGRVRRSRVPGLDRIRGLAIACMVIDHLCHFAIRAGAGELVLVRDTVGRVAVPLFFVLSGHLVRRFRWRHVGIGAVGVVLPLVATWIDSPNVLVWYALGAFVLVVARWGGIPPAVVVVLVLTMAANQWIGDGGGGYPAQPLVGLMALGAMLPASAFAWGDRLPRLVEPIGRRPMLWYVGHVLVLTVLARGAGLL